MSFGGGSTAALPNKKPKPLGVDEDRFSTNEQAKPVPYFAGKIRIACNFISEVFDVVKHSVNVNAGKKPARAGTSYFASFAAVIAHGPVDAIYAVILNGDRVWPPEGSSEFLVRDGDNPEFIDLTIEDYGLIRFYWGTETQPADDYIRQKTGITHPPYQGMCYLVAHQLFLGINQTNVQNFEVVVGRYPIIPGMSSPGSIGSDGNPANILYELLTHPRFGRGIDTEKIDASGLETLGIQLYDEDIGISPLLTSQKDAISYIVELLEYFDGYPVISNEGILSFGSARPGDAVLGAVDESLMIDPINVTPEDWSTTFSQTQIKFSNPDQNYDPDAKTWRDRGNFQVTGQLNTQTLERLWITNPALADFQATAAGRSQSLPAASGQLSLRRTSLFDSLTPGGLFTLTYPPRGYVDLRCRITDITVPDPAKPSYQVAWKLDRSYLLAGLTVSGLFIPASTDPVEVEQIADYLLTELPLPLCPEGRLSLAVLCSRPEALTSGFNIHLGKNYDETGLIVPESFDVVGGSTSFAFHGTVLEDYPDSTDEVDRTVGLVMRLDGQDTELPEQTEFDALSDSLLVFLNGEVLSVFEAGLVGLNTYRLLCIRGRIGTPVQSHSIGDEAFIIERGNIIPIQADIFEPTNTADIKIQAYTGAGSADLSMAPEPTLEIAGRIYAEPPPAITLDGQAPDAVASSGADVDIVITRGDSGELPHRSDLLTYVYVLDFYDSTGVTLLGSQEYSTSSFTILTADLSTLTASAALFQIWCRVRTVGDWWEVETDSTVLNVELV